MQMADGSVALDAPQGAPALRRRGDGVHDVGVTGTARGFGDDAIALVDADGLVKRPVVNANECQNPLRALVVYFGSTACGVWQSLHPATARWLEAIQPSYCSRMMWQFAHAAGSFVRYDAPRAYTNV
jgi:hypothetical protein